jgi:hypothetical protein
VIAVVVEVLDRRRDHRGRRDALLLERTVAAPEVEDRHLGGVQEIHPVVAVEVAGEEMPWGPAGRRRDGEDRLLRERAAVVHQHADPVSGVGNRGGAGLKVGDVVVTIAVEVGRREDLDVLRRDQLLLDRPRASSVPGQHHDASFGTLGRPEAADDQVRPLVAVDVRERHEARSLAAVPFSDPAERRQRTLRAEGEPGEQDNEYSYRPATIHGFHCRSISSVF